MPWALIPSILGFTAVAVTQVAYEIDGWGTGELVVDGRTRRVARVALAAGEHSYGPIPNPRPPGARAWRSTESVTRTGQLCRGSDRSAAQLLRRRLRGARWTCRSISSTRRRSLSACATALRAVPPGEVVTYGELAALAGAPGAARAAGSFCARNRLGLFVPCHRVVAADGPRLVRQHRRRLQAPPARPRGIPRCSLTTSARSSPQSRPSASATGSPSSPASFTSPAAPTSAAAAALTSISTSRARPSRAALSRSSARSTSPPRSARTAAPPSTTRRATSSMSRDRTRRTGCSIAPASSTARIARSTARLRASSRGAAAPPPTSVARCSEREASAGRATRTSRSAQEKPTAPVSSPTLAARLGAELHVQERETHATAYAKGAEAIADTLVAAGAVDVVLALEEQAVLAATRADANRLANADHANLVRTSRAAHAQLEALRQHRRRRASRRPARDRPSPAAPPDRLDGRARAPLQAGLSKAAAYRRLRRLQELAGRLECTSSGTATARHILAAAGPCSSGGRFRPRLSSGLERVKGREGRPRSFPARPPYPPY